MVMSVGPALSPVIGGVGEELVNWRFGFGFCAVIGVGMFFWLWRALSETRVVPAEGYPPVGELLRRYGGLLSNRSFLGYSLALAFLSSCFYGFSVGAPALFAYRYGITPPQFGIAMFCISLGFVVGSFVAARAARYLTLNRMLVLGSSGIAATMALLMLGAWVDDFYYYVAVMIAYALANGFVYPTSISGAISVDPGIAGAASAFLGFTQQAVCAIVTFAVGAVAGPDPIAFLSITLVAGLLCPASLVLIARPSRR
jgi:DHA1 family bicyclomycin/chloramphenicol resistance-like MFS transporter